MTKAEGLAALKASLDFAKRNAAESIEALLAAHGFAVEAEPFLAVCLEGVLADLQGARARLGNLAGLLAEKGSA